MKLKIYKTDGSETSRSATLDPSVFAVEPNDHAIWLDVRSIQANGRQGTHKAKERSEVRGGGAKPWRQKGTGRARVGTIRSPLWVGGGTTFGPRPRAYKVGVNRKTKQLARRSALTYRAQADAIRIVEDFSIETPRTRTVADLLAALDLTGQKVLLLTGAPDVVLYKSGRNIPKVRVCDAASASTRDLLDAGVILMLESALDAISESLGSGDKIETPVAEAEGAVVEAEAEDAVVEAPAEAEPMPESEASEPVTQPDDVPDEEAPVDEAVSDEVASDEAVSDEAVSDEVASDETEAAVAEAEDAVVEAPAEAEPMPESEASEPVTQPDDVTDEEAPVDEATEDDTDPEDKA